MTDQRRAQLGRQTTILCTIAILVTILTQPGCQRRAAEERLAQAQWDSLMSVIAEAEHTPFTMSAITEFNPPHPWDAMPSEPRSQQISAPQPILDLDTAAHRLYRAEREFLRAKGALDLARQEWDRSHNKEWDRSHNNAYRP